MKGGHEQTNELHDLNWGAFVTIVHMCVHVCVRH